VSGPTATGRPGRVRPGHPTRHGRERGTTALRRTGSRGHGDAETDGAPEAADGAGAPAEELGPAADALGPTDALGPADGLGAPSWDGAAPEGVAGDDDPADGTLLGEGEAEAEAGGATTVGVGVGWTGPGTKATIAARTRVAVAMPASRPMMTARRDGMAGGYQYHAAAAASGGTD
jgi:hypothetical protein